MFICLSNAVRLGDADANTTDFVIVLPLELTKRRSNYEIENCLRVRLSNQNTQVHSTIEVNTGHK